MLFVVYFAGAVNVYIIVKLTRHSGCRLVAQTRPHRAEQERLVVHRGRCIIRRRRRRRSEASCLEPLKLPPLPTLQWLCSAY